MRGLFVVVIMMAAYARLVQVNDAAHFNGVPIWMAAGGAACGIDLDGTGVEALVINTPSFKGFQAYRRNLDTGMYEDVFARHFLTPRNCPVECWLVPVDVDGDGRKDLVNGIGSTIEILYANATNYYVPDASKMADALANTGDGSAVAVRAAGRHTVFFHGFTGVSATFVQVRTVNESDGRLYDTVAETLPNFDPMSYGGLAAGDYDGDGDDDIVMSGYVSGPGAYTRLEMYLQNATGAFVLNASMIEAGKPIGCGESQYSLVTFNHLDKWYMAINGYGQVVPGVGQPFTRVVALYKQSAPRGALLHHTTYSPSAPGGFNYGGSVLGPLHAPSVLEWVAAGEPQSPPGQGYAMRYIPGNDTVVVGDGLPEFSESVRPTGQANAVFAADLLGNGRMSVVVMGNTTLAQVFENGCAKRNEVLTAAFACEPCASGVPNTRQEACVDCPAGMAPDSLGATCVVCLANTIVTPQACVACASTKVPNADRSACVDCPAGEAPNADGSTCVSSEPASHASTISICLLL